MSDSETPDYLKDGFDPSTVNVARLRNILVTHDVQYPSNAKKPALIEAFNQQIVPQRKNILAKSAQARRTSKGIVDAGSSQDTLNMDDVPDLQPRRSSVRVRSRSPRKSSHIKLEEPEYHSLPRTTRSASRQASVAHDTEPLPLDYGLRSTRKSRHRSPEVKREETDDTDVFRRISGGHDTNFSEENPFQSGSSPIPVSKSTGRRKTADAGTMRAKRSSSKRRSHIAPITPSIERDDTSQSDLAPTPITPVSDLYDVDPGEEFTPDAQLELEQELAVMGDARAAAYRPKREGGLWLATPLKVLLTAVVVACALWYRQQKIAVGYCGLGRNTAQVFPSDLSIPDWLRTVVEPECEACPPHAYCFEDFLVKCEQDYILTHHPLSLGGLIPLPPTCEPDGEKVRRVKAVADKAVEELRDRRAKYECGELTDEQGEQLESAFIDEQELKESISKKRGKRLNDREFDELWEAAIGEITNREEVEVATPIAGDSGGIPNRRLSSTSLAQVPLLCSIKRSFRLSLARYRLHLGSVATLLFLLMYLRYKYRSSRTMSAVARDLAQEVIERLEAQKQRSEENPQQELDGWLFLPNLRDDILRDIPSLAEREKLWSRVRPLVEQNANVRTGQREGRSGEVARAWEWIGQGVRDSTKLHRRRSRLSNIGLGKLGSSSDFKIADEDALAKEGKLIGEKRWTEGGRAIF